MTFRAFWSWLSGIRLTLWLLVLISLNLFVGSFYVKALPVYDWLNRSLLFEWFRDYSGWHAWWLVLLLSLLTLLGINTFACTLNRVLNLWSTRRNYRTYVLCLLLAPSMMHVCFLLLLMGHALTDFTGIKTGVTASAGATTEINGRTVEVMGQHCRYHEESVLSGFLQQCEARVLLTYQGEQQEKALELLQPIYWRGLSLHLGMAGKLTDFQTPELAITVKRDPGMWLILLGNGILCLLMLWYFPGIQKLRSGGNK